MASPTARDASQSVGHGKVQASGDSAGSSHVELSETMHASHDMLFKKATKRKAVERKRLTVSLPLELLERSRNTVYWTKGLTLAQLLEQALNYSLDQRERLHGQPFPKRLEDLKGGRPPNSARTDYPDCLSHHELAE